MDTIRVCMQCHTDLVTLDYHSPMWADRVLLGAVLRVSCECGETYDFISTAWRGERLATFPPDDMSIEDRIAAFAEINCELLSDKAGGK